MLKDRMKQIKNEFMELEDTFLRYSFLTELSVYTTNPPKELLCDEYLFPGCQSRVWLKIDFIDGHIQIQATSDTMIIRGLLYVISELFNGCTAKEIVDTPIDILDLCGVSGNFSNERTANIKHMTNKIMETATAYLNTSV